jgi:hypothetical protein
MIENGFTPEERKQAEVRINAVDPVVAESEKRYAADPDAWLATERARCAAIEVELRSSVHSSSVCPVADGKYVDLQDVSVRPI